MQLKKHNLVLLALALLISFAPSVSAQRRDREREPKREREYKAEKEATNDFTSKLWYGGGVNIGFGAFNGGSIFVFGLSPMVGYKIAGPLSAGPRVAYDFTSLKQPGFKATALHSWDVGGFVRCRVFRGLFLQAELSNKWFQDKDLNTQERFTDQRVNQRLGAGWNFGEPGGVGSEISILYNFKVANDINGWDNPVEYRFGFTWKF
ncbi:MAG: hypothetical protein Q7T20_05720 [Saprospiraceae bacterium]|nr:hypothetical protein [Saprospiraceae bacterium]